MPWGSMCCRLAYLWTKPPKIHLHRISVLNTKQALNHFGFLCFSLPVMVLSSSEGVNGPGYPAAVCMPCPCSSFLCHCGNISTSRTMWAEPVVWILPIWLLSSKERRPWPGEKILAAISPPMKLYTSQCYHSEGIGNGFFADQGPHSIPGSLPGATF